jgi:hypothetical protein
VIGPGANTDPLWFFWGQQNMTFMRYMTLRSACAVHADVRLVTRDSVAVDVQWNESQDFQFVPIGQNWFDEVRRLPVKIQHLKDLAPSIAAMNADDVHTSDLLAWHLLATEGGTVADMDIVFLSPLPRIAEPVQIAVHRVRSPYVPVAFMQGKPHPFWSKTLSRALAAYVPAVYECCGARSIAKPWPDPCLSPSIVYPWVGSAWQQIFNYCFAAPHWPPIPAECIGIHWYGGANWEANRKITGPSDEIGGAAGWAVRKVLSR